MSSSMDIQHFSPKVLEEIFSMLAPKDLISLSQTCVLFHKIINQSDQLWANVCFNKFKIRVPPANGFARRFYRNVLHSYGHLLDFWYWKKGVDFGGNLLQIKYSDGQLHGMALEASNVPTDPAGHFVSKPMFNIYMDEEDHCVIKCCSDTCLNKDPLLQSDLDLQYVYQKQLPANGSTGSKSPVSWYLVIRSRSMCIPERHYSRLHFPPMAPSSAVPIQPGLFTLTTAANMPDESAMIDIRILPKKSLVMLTYDDHWQTATVRQITGNINRFIDAGRSGNVNFQADLHRCAYLDQEVHWDKDLPRQPSSIPEVYREKIPYLPNDCLARVRETGAQVRRPNYCWIVFNQDTFVFRNNWSSDPNNFDWLRMYHRVKDSLLQQL